MIISAIEKQEKLIDWVKEMMKNLDEYDGLFYSLETLLEKNDFSDFLLVIDEKENIVDLIYQSTVMDVETLYPYFIDKKETVSQIKKQFPNSIIEVNKWEGECLIDEGATQLSMKSSFCNQKYECLDGVFYSFNKDNEFILRDKIEEKYFFDTDEDIKVEIINGEEVNHYLLKEDYSYPMWKTENNHSVIIGFHYLTPDFFDHNTLLVLKSKDIILGTIKYGLYGEGKFKHYGLNFIDVNFYHRKKGLAKRLIQELKKVLPTDYPLVLTDESDMGKKCQMARHFKEVFTENIYTRKEWDEYNYNGKYLL